MELHAYAKLNLTLDVLERRPDGYHNLQSVFQFIDLHDTVVLEKSAENSFWCSRPELAGPDNLVLKARDRLAREYPIGPVAISLLKEIPVMSGMGGGSADCAAVLRGLNELFGLHIPAERLLAIAAELGADVPACLVGGLLLAGGIGEQITPLAQGAPLWFCVVKPEVAFSTAEMYRALGRTTRPRPLREIAPLLAALQRGDAAAVARGMFNSFEAVARPAEPIEAARAALRQSGALAAMMTGSGSAVFGLYADAAAACAAHTRLGRQGWQVWLCRSAPPAAL